jgi:pilus assembly protein TadC
MNEFLTLFLLIFMACCIGARSYEKYLRRQKIANYASGFKLIEGETQSLFLQWKIDFQKNKKNIIAFVLLILFLIVSIITYKHIHIKNKFMVFLSIFIGGVLLFIMVLRQIEKKRRDKIIQYFPDLVDLIILCVQAGMTVEDALHRIVKQQDLIPIEMQNELQLLLGDMRFLLDRNQAFHNFSKRLHHNFVYLFVQIIILSQKQGTPILNSLKNLIQDYRQDRITRMEEKAARLPVILTLPLILFIMPTVFIVILGPSVLKLMDMMGNK